MRKKEAVIPDGFWNAFGIPSPQREHRFHKVRRWRIDYAWPEVKLALEIEGGIYTRGRHTRPKGFLGDIEKYNALTECGWHLLRYPPNLIQYEQVLIVYQQLEMITKLLKGSM